MKTIYRHLYEGAHYESTREQIFRGKLLDLRRDRVRCRTARSACVNTCGTRGRWRSSRNSTMANSSSSVSIAIR
jgi:hypothetical protein